PGPLVHGPACHRCGDALPGDPIVATKTGIDGSFALDGVPAGDARIVIATGGWRRQVMVPGVVECGDIALDPASTRLPRNRAEGDLPTIAVGVTADPLECVWGMLGVDTDEITTESGGGSIHLFASSGLNATTTMKSGEVFPAESVLTGDAVRLAG